MTTVSAVEKAAAERMAEFMESEAATLPLESPLRSMAVQIAGSCSRIAARRQLRLVAERPEAS